MSAHGHRGGSERGRSSSITSAGAHHNVGSRDADEGASDREGEGLQLERRLRLQLPPHLGRRTRGLELPSRRRQSGYR